MRLFPSKIIALSLAFLTFFQPFSVVRAQSGSQDEDGVIVVPSQDRGRSTGTSFGTKKDGQLRKQSLPEEKSQLPSLPMSPQGPGGILGGMMGGLTYQVHILGEVQRPGTYRIPASTRLSEAVQMAGGFKEQGSERRIQLRRQGGGSRSVDLLAFKFFGNLDANPYLLDNDAIMVPLRERVIEVEGSVKRPGAYEMRGERTIEDALKLAGGFTPGAEAVHVLQVVRYIGGSKEVIPVSNTSVDRKSFRIEAADIIVVPHFLIQDKKFDYNVAKLPGDNPLFYPSYEERVFILGAVAKPGPYQFSQYYSVRHYLTLAGGTTKMGKPKKIKVVTADGRTVKAKENMEINPGDTIVVPEKALAPETWATLLLSAVAVAATVISVVTR